MPLFWSGIGTPITVLIDVYNHRRTVYTHMSLIVRMVVAAPVTVPVTVMGIIMVPPVIMVTIVIVIVMSSPWVPIGRVVSPIPG